MHGVVADVESTAANPYGFATAIIASIECLGHVPCNAHGVVIFHGIEVDVTGHSSSADMAEDDVNGVAGLEVYILQIGDSLSAFCLFGSKRLLNGIV
ncbi:hypothetical protein AW736_09080 [Termitidicoccus mucosus]|uniref:Uncharacterized protein n=1 Tax=Termitidicoccus mucosus TaxID=1184151 RepID=A0A178II76_9BACT|nr:hypothetical protein AW736_09080 [Opitutaceae bacterium TSB47]